MNMVLDGNGKIFYTSNASLSHLRMHRTTGFKLSEHTVYRFIDWNRDFVDSDDFDELNILTTDKAVFEKYIDTYDPKPGMPFFFEVQDGYVTKIVEKPIM